jgi:hypothetical protein
MNENEVLAGFFVTVFYIVAFLAFFLGSALVNGFVLCYMWGWFIAPIFGVAVPGYWIASGVMMTVRFITFTYVDDKRPMKEKVMWSIVFPSVALGCAWMVHALAVR